MSRRWYVTAADGAPVTWPDVVVDGRATVTVLELLDPGDPGGPVFETVWAYQGALVQAGRVAAAQAVASVDDVPGRRRPPAPAPSTAAPVAGGSAGGEAVADTVDSLGGTGAAGRDSMRAGTPAQGRSAIGAVSVAQVDSRVQALMGAAPEALDTLAELAAALGDDPDFAATVTAALAERSRVGHGHVIADVEGLAGVLAGKAAAADVAALTAALAGRATPEQVDARILAVVGSAPGALDTLDELAAALGDDANFAGTVTAALAERSRVGHKHTAADVTDFAVAARSAVPGARVFVLDPGVDPATVSPAIPAGSVILRRTAGA